MNFKMHFERMRIKITNLVGQMRRVLKSEWGMRKHAVRIVYKGLFCLCDVRFECLCESMRSKYARV